MAKIKELYNQDDKFTLIIEVDKKEIGETLNVLEDIYLITQSRLNFTSKLVKRGVSDLTQYVLIPMELRNKFKKSEHNKIVKFGKIGEDLYIFKLNKK